MLVWRAVVSAFCDIFGIVIMIRKKYQFCMLSVNESERDGMGARGSQPYDYDQVDESAPGELRACAFAASAAGDRRRTASACLPAQLDNIGSDTVEKSSTAPAKSLSGNEAIEKISTAPAKNEYTQSPTESDTGEISMAPATSFSGNETVERISTTPANLE